MHRFVHVPHAARALEVVLAHVPRNADRLEKLTLGGLAAMPTLLHSVYSPRGNAGPVRQVALRPAESLTCSSNPIHRERNLEELGALVAW